MTRRGSGGTGARKTRSGGGKKQSGPTPTKRTLDRCRGYGWDIDVVERWIPRVKVRKDLFGFGDLLALDHQPGSLVIQATSAPNVSARLNKIEALDVARRWVGAGNRIEVWGWGKYGKAGKAKTWKARRVALTLDGTGAWVRTELEKA